MTPLQPSLASSIRKRSKRSYYGSAMNTNIDGHHDGLRRHKTCNRVDDVDSLCYPTSQKDIGQLMIRSGLLKNDWLGLWREPLQNPFNMYGTLPSKTKSRDKRKAFSVPPLDDYSMVLSKEDLESPEVVAATKCSKAPSNTNAHCMNALQKRMFVPRSIQMQRISTILSEPKSSRSSITASTARSTIDSFRYSDSFDECVIDTPPGESSKYLEGLMNDLYVITGNGFLSGSLPESPWHNKDEMDADFIAISLARRPDCNPCLALFNDLEALVTMSSRHRRYKGYEITSPPRRCQQNNYMLYKGIDSIGHSMNWMESRSPPMVRSLRYRGALPDLRLNAFKITTEGDMLLWNASTESARTTMQRAGVVQRPVRYDVNDDFMVTDADDYAILQTRFGRIIYSPKFRDERYMYRFVVLTKEAQEAVEALSRTSPKQSRSGYPYTNPITGKRCLTEFEIIRQLGIQMSPGWEHFMYFKNSQKELVLRKRL